MSIELDVNAVDCTAYLDHSSGDPVTFDLIAGHRGTATVNLTVAAGDSFAVLEGQPISILDSGTCVFAGTVDVIQQNWTNDAGARTYQLTVVSLEQLFDKILIIPTSWFGQQAGVIFDQLMLGQCSGTGVTEGFLDFGATIDTFITNFDTASSVFDQLAQLSGYVWYIDPSVKKIYFQTPSAAAPITLANTDLVWGTTQWEKNRQDFRNRATLRTSFDAFQPVYEMFAGNSSTTAFTTRDPVDNITLAQVTHSTQGTVTGTFTGQPSALDTITIGDVVFQFVSSLDNAQFGQVLIGGAAAASLQNLVDAINAKVAAQRVTISLPTWPHDTCTSDQPSGLSFTVRAGYPGTVGNGHVVSESCANFTWGGGATAGGTDGAITVLSVALVGSATANCVYTKGDTTVHVFPAPASGTSLMIGYYRLGQDCVTVEDSVSVAARAAVEGGTGIYHVLTEDSTQKGAALEGAQALLPAYNILPETFTFTTDTAGLAPGQQLPISVSVPAGLGTVVNATWLIQEVRADYFQRAAGDTFRYTVSVISGNTATWLAFWEGLTGGGSSGSSSAGGVTGGGAGLASTIHALPTSGNMIPIAGPNVTNQAILVGSATLKPPATATPQEVIRVQLQQDATGGWAVTFDAFYTGLSTFILDLTASTQTTLVFQINAAGTAGPLMGVLQSGQTIV